MGIILYGVTKSGSRHLQREGAFQRSGLDLFHLETDSNLGEVWKIRLWHDNTGNNDNTGNYCSLALQDFVVLYSLTYWNTRKVGDRGSR